MAKDGSAPGWRSLLTYIVCVSLAGCAQRDAADADAFQGVVELDTVVLGFEVPGKVAEVAVHEGDHLRGDTLLARLSDTLVVAERAASAAELAAARARLSLLDAGARREDIAALAAELDSVRRQQDVLVRQRTRQDALLAAGAVPRASIDALDTQHSALHGQQKVLEERLHTLRAGARSQERDALTANVRALEAGLLAMDERVTRYRLSHHGDTDVLEVHVDPEEVVAPGAPAFTLADLDHPFVEVFVPQGRISQVRLNGKASIRVDALAAPIKGYVERIATHTEFTPRYLFSARERTNLVVRVRIRIEDPHHRLRAGVPAFVRVEG